MQHPNDIVLRQTPGRDATASEIARARGAEVLQVPRRGLGRAYIDAIPSITGDYVIMGDCDLTYDFRAVAPFVAKLDEGVRVIAGHREETAVVGCAHQKRTVPV